ncbi:unnamed protein product [Psylliodes chrysocephalus]|uniref:Major facilitator superfamily (MFS) profile domain-containing protein n=1 Tax=Psylliodes chrysocephalus TaxID=3402493 RepID=A0A9P0D802_9CUCU|nr:unnamed protein product [Psylliodes chrysocephala]
MVLLPRIDSVYVPAGAASIIFFVAGTTCTWSSPEIPKLEDASENPFGRPITPYEISWISSLLALGAIFGPFMFGYLADKIGRKNTMLCVGVPFLVSYTLMAVGTVVEIFYLARALAGISLGGTFIVLPMYLSEIAESKNRGLISCAAGCSCCMGLLFTVCFGPYKPIGYFNAVMAMPPLIFLVLFGILGVESPIYLVKKQQSDKAELILKHLGRSPEMIKKDIIEMQAEYQVKEEPFNTLDFFTSKPLLKGIISAVGILIFQQLSGINAIMFYSEQIFREAGTKLAPTYCTMILIFVQFISSFIAPFLVDRIGRKVCLVISGVGMVLTEGTLGLFCYFKHEQYDLSDITWIPIAALTTFIVFFNVGFGPLPWIIMAEMFSNKYKSFAIGFVATVAWVASFLVTKCFDVAVTSFGMDNVFFFCALCCFLSIIFTTIYLIETKGKSLQEIQELLSK